MRGNLLVGLKLDIGFSYVETGQREQYSELRIRQFFKARFGCVALLCLKQSKTKTRRKIKQFGCVSNSGLVCLFICLFLFVGGCSLEAQGVIVTQQVEWGGRRRMGEEKPLRTFGKQGTGWGDVWASGHKKRCLKTACGTAVWPHHLLFCVSCPDIFS